MIEVERESTCMVSRKTCDYMQRKKMKKSTGDAQSKRKNVKR